MVVKYFKTKKDAIVNSLDGTVCFYKNNVYCYGLGPKGFRSKYLGTDKFFELPLFNLENLQNK